MHSIRCASYYRIVDRYNRKWKVVNRRIVDRYNRKWKVVNRRIVEEFLFGLHNINLMICKLFSIKFQMFWQLTLSQYPNSLALAVCARSLKMTLLGRNH
jgi:hypothetical protein